KQMVDFAVKNPQIISAMGNVVAQVTSDLPQETKVGGLVGGGLGVTVGATIGGVVGIIGGPAGIALGATLGGIIGGMGGTSVGAGVASFAKTKPNQQKQHVVFEDDMLQKSGKKYVVALRDYYGEEDELSFNKGDVIEILDTDTEYPQMWYGKLNGKRGFVPISLVRMV